MVVNDIRARMAQIARDVQSGDDVARAVDRICAAAVDLLEGKAQAAISIAHRGRRVENLGATTEAVRRGDELQAELGEGPCLDAVWDQEQVIVRDLATEDRWPRWAPRMAEWGIQSLLCTQLFTNERQLGALNA